MLDLLLELGGWCLFLLFLVRYVSSVFLERRLFAGSDPEVWRPAGATGDTSEPGPIPAPPVRFPALISLGNPS